jgi:hypothetical protein
MDTRTCYCRHRSCRLYGRTGQGAQLHPRGTHNHAPRFECGACGHLVFARTGTAYAGIRLGEAPYRFGTTLLAEGLAIRATARILEVDKDTVTKRKNTLSPSNKWRACMEMLGSGSLSRRSGNWFPPGWWANAPFALSFAYSHFVIPHRGLRQRLEFPVPTKGTRGSPKSWRERTPALAAG